ncbi:C45 family autoproteolytic acyltransferase/hydrolase [Rhodovibrionaceae bacterium A322]
MNVIEANGSPRDLGRALGVAGKTALVEDAFNTAQFQTLSQWIGSSRVEQILAAAERNFPEIVEEIRGIAEGAEQPFEKVFVWNCRGDLRDLARSDDDGCTTFQLPASEKHPATIGHNEDGAPAFQGKGFMVKAKPDQGPAFEAFCYPGMLPGHAFGYNANGLVQTINNIRPHDLTVGIPRHVITRAILSCKDMAQALELTRRTDRASGFHHNLGSCQQPNLYSVEAPASGQKALEVSAPLAHANHLLYPAFTELPQDITPSTASRQARADELLAQGGGEDGNPLPLLFDNQNRDLPILCRAEQITNESYTLASAWFRLHSDRVELSIHHGPDPAAVYESAFYLG